jgi:oligoribonuclease NrnB/cAMP/cGMP phosphodiesterase (DHH superfamily)
MKNIVIYHGQCMDGFCAAWCAWLKFGNEAEYHPVSYLPNGEDPQVPDVVGKHVFILDFSYSPETLRAIERCAASVELHDHHASAFEKYEKDRAEGGKWKDTTVIKFEQEYSGAGLAWFRFGDGGPLPWLVAYVQDRDLWRHALKNTKSINAFIRTLPFDFDAWDKANSEVSQREASAFGEGALVYVNKYVKDTAAEAQRVNFMGHPDIPLVNAQYSNISEVLNELAQTAKFAVGWFVQADGSIKVSLRSAGNFSVKTLAVQMGGGGHEKASGFVAKSMIHLDVPGVW